MALDRNLESTPPIKCWARSLSHFWAEHVKPKVNRSRLGKRHWIIVLGFFGSFNIYVLRANLSLAIVAMVVWNPPVMDLSQNTTDTMFSDVCEKPAVDSAANSTRQTRNLSPQFLWDTKTQGIILGSYFYGYVLTQMAGGWLTRMYGGKHPFGIGIFITGILALLTPLAASLHYGYVIALRVLQGLATGFCYPALQQVVAHWSPPSERTKFSSLINAGAPVGTVTVLTMAGFLADRLGWESVFYVSGAMTIVWYLAWIFMVYDSPVLHPGITDEELILITGHSKTHHRLSNANQVRQKIPWRSILTSVPVWVMIGAHTGQNWGTYTLLTSLPTYMKHILHFNLSSNGVFSALPYLAMWFVGVFSGYSSDMLRTRKVLSTTNVRKLYNTIGNVVPTFAIIAVGFVGCDSIAAVALLTIGTGFSGCTAASNQVNSIDLSPAFSSVIYGISNTIANIPGIVSPYTVGLITAGPNGQTISNWRIIFYLSGAVRIAAAVPYLLFASGELADWNETGHKELSQDKEGAENAFD